ncbi:DUF2637 domain-containing protein [Gordonia paraffinivorans]|uniref:DUF2637 domain-containing protein n=1 Tax=Gordonia paraffinivorans TaxID=175628 RepID=UPI001447A1F5|nr:DUF2637 domain-containing protein [Gordonia paraffinivorans]
MRRDDGAEQEGMTLAWFLVRSFTALSVLFNCAHAVLVLTERGAGLFEKVMAVFVAALFPVALLATTELALRLIRGWPRGQRWYLAVGRLLVIAGVVTVGIVAFFRSYGALRDMGQTLGIPAAESWMLPVVVDLVIVFGTIAVLVLETQAMIEAAERQAQVAADATAGHADADDVMSRDSDHHGGQAPEPVLAHGTAEPDTASELSAGQPDRPGTDSGHGRHAAVSSEWHAGVARGPEPGVNGVRAAVSAEPAYRLSRAADLHVDSGTPASEPVVQAAEDTSEDTADTAVPDTEDSSLIAGTDTVDSAPEDTDAAGADTSEADTEDTADSSAASVTDISEGAGLDVSAVAAWVVDEAGTTADPAVVERALRLSLQGLSVRKIVEALGPDGPSRTPVAGWIKAAKTRPDYAAAADAPVTPRLAVVSSQ